MLSVALAISAVLPGSVAIAREPDQEREGATAPEPAPPDGTADPRFDLGGETHLPFNLGAPTDGSDDDSGDGPPVDTEPTTDPDALSLPLDDPGAAPDAVEVTDEPVAPLEAPAPPPIVPATPPAAAPQVEAPSTPTVERRPSDRGKANTTRKRARDRAQRPMVQMTIPAPVPAPAPAAPALESVAATTATAPDKPARPSQRSYRVQPDDSLWKIASDLLGAGATNAEIAAESNRLFGLNRDRIGDDPNMLIAGTVLRLR